MIRVCGILSALLAVAGLALAQPATSVPSQYQTGKIVRIDPDLGVVVIRALDGKETAYRLSPATQFYGPADAELRGGIAANGWREAGPVYYLTGPNNTLRALRMAPVGGTGGTGGGVSGKVPGGVTPGNVPPPPGM